MWQKVPRDPAIQPSFPRRSPKRVRPCHWTCRLRSQVEHRIVDVQRIDRAQHRGTNIPAASLSPILRDASIVDSAVLLGSRIAARLPVSYLSQQTHSKSCEHLTCDCLFPCSLPAFLSVPSWGLRLHNPWRGHHAHRLTSSAQLATRLCIRKSFLTTRCHSRSTVRFVFSVTCSV